MRGVSWGQNHEFLKVKNWCNIVENLIDEMSVIKFIKALAPELIDLGR